MLIASILAALLIAPAPARSPMAAAALPACTPGQLSLGFDGEGGAFDGMSHSGALLVVRNLGPAACRLEGLPVVQFLDSNGAVLDVTRQAPIGMHPGPVVLPVGIAAGAEATTPLRWVSGDVYSGGRCRAVRSAGITVGGQRLSAPLTATICSPAGQPAKVEQPVLRTDPVL